MRRFSQKRFRIVFVFSIVFVVCVGCDFEYDNPAENGQLSKTTSDTEVSTGSNDIKETGSDSLSTVTQNVYRSTDIDTESSADTVYTETDTSSPTNYNNDTSYDTAVTHNLQTGDSATETADAQSEDDSNSVGVEDTSMTSMYDTEAEDEDTAAKSANDTDDKDETDTHDTGVVSPNDTETSSLHTVGSDDTDSVNQRNTETTDTHDAGTTDAQDTETLNIRDTSTDYIEDTDAIDTDDTGISGADDTDTWPDTDTGTDPVLTDTAYLQIGQEEDGAWRYWTYSDWMYVNPAPACWDLYNKEGSVYTDLDFMRIIYDQGADDTLEMFSWIRYLPEQDSWDDNPENWGDYWIMGDYMGYFFEEREDMFDVDYFIGDPWAKFKYRQDDISYVIVFRVKGYN